MTDQTEKRLEEFLTRAIQIGKKETSGLVLELKEDMRELKQGQKETIEHLRELNHSKIKHGFAIRALQWTCGVLALLLGLLLVESGLVSNKIFELFS